MTDKSEGEQGKEASDAPKEALWSGAVHRIKRKLKERRANKQNEKPQDRAARHIMWATWVIAVFTAVTVVVAAATYYVISDQLDAALRDQRAWVGVESASAYADLVQGDGNVTFYIRLVLKNAGRAPAVVKAAGRGVIVDPVIGDWRTAQKDECRRLQNAASDNWSNSHIIIPGGASQYDVAFMLDRKLIAQAGETYVPRLVGCVVYRSVSDYWTRQTPFIVTVSPNAGEPRPVPFSVHESRIPRDRLAVQAFGAGDAATD